ncbi:MAG: NADH-quinone oxidoreductase subunit L [Isosphaeraceae bacterium]|nr:NADH-quinone oxidoreductase subunit L [Isosphaeraceae bacterium]
MSWQVWLYVAAVLIPLVAFTMQLLFVRVLGRLNAYLATGAIALSFVLSLVGFLSYFAQARGVFSHHAVSQAGPEQVVEGTAPGEHAEHAESHHEPLAWKGSFNWITLGSDTLFGQGKSAAGTLSVPLGVYIDNLAVIMFLMVTFIATLIHIYSMGYMHDDPRYPRFFTYLSLFCFSMLGLVASANVFMIFMFWELVGVCSYLLIGFWYEEKKNVDAANKAFVTNRIGDVGMLVGLGILWTTFGTFDMNSLNRGFSAAELRHPESFRITRDVAHETVSVQVPETNAAGQEVKTTYKIPYWMLVVAGLGIFAGCVGKSAQFPLHVWLPDAMAGPTPVSALIHAATMVAAGVYFVGRFYPLFTDEVLLYIAYTGGITLFIAASIAVVQTDYKKVLAYSTVSQLGYMMLGLGVGGWAAGLFHLITHACFKALLFLGAGSVYHSVHTYEMPVLGGLRKKMPITAYTMLAATLAISGVPFFSGFYSKDAILASAWFRVFAEHGQSGHILLFLLPAIGAAMTAFYMFRMWFLTFGGEPRGYPPVAAGDHGHGHAAHGHGDHHTGNPYDHAHESEPIMTWPLLALAVPTIFVGWTWWIGLPFGEPVLEQMLAYGEPLRAIDLGAAHYYAMFASLLVATAGIGGAIAYYAPSWSSLFSYNVPAPLRRRLEARRTAERFGGVYNFLVHKWYFDELYWAVLVRPTLAFCQLCSRFDKMVVDGIVNSSAWLTELLSRAEGLFDKIAVDGAVNLVAKGVYATGDWSRSIQTGRLRNYLMFLAVAVVGLFAGVFAWIKG